MVDERPRPGAVFDSRGFDPETHGSRSDIPISLLGSVDAIFVLGGGVPSSFDDPPVYVKERCDVAGNIFRTLKAEGGGGELPAILTLSAGTAHMPQFLSQDGLPVWEATASAAYIMDKHGVPSEKVFVETTSYDTISNAYFARTSFTDVIGWKTLLIITNEFHMARSKAIFDWVFGAEHKFGNPDAGQYELYYLSCKNVGLSKEALAVRSGHEARSEKTVKTKLKKQYATLQGVFTFLTQNHDFYNARKLVDRAGAIGGGDSFDPRSHALKLSYGAGAAGGGSSSYVLGSIALAVAVFVAITLKSRNHPDMNPFKA